MERKDILLVLSILIVIIATAFLLYWNVRDKVLYSPDDNLPSEDLIDLQTPFCYDSDSGLDYFEEGKVLWGRGDGGLHESRDYCATDPNRPANTLFEMHCVGNSFKIKDVQCPGICEKGICTK